MKRNFLSLGCLAIALVLLWTNYHRNAESNNVKSSLLKQNVEALTQGENSSLEGTRLKMIECECVNGKKGKTLKCRRDGSLEKCTFKQQGSVACYKVKLSGLELC